VLVNVPYLDGTTHVRRPVLVIGDPSIMLDVIIAAITSRIRTPLPNTHYVLDSQHPDWQSSGLRLPSVVRCDRLFTIAHADIHKVLGRIAPATLQQISVPLKAALGLS
jgi:mRNA interferase MazF